jgi:hypothetical protein
MPIIQYHVFYEDQDYGGFYIGSYQDEDAAKKMGDYLWELFDNRFKQKAIEEFNEILESSRKYPIMKEKEFLLRDVWGASTGMNWTRIFRSRDDGFVEKYIRFMGEGQSELRFED